VTDSPTERTTKSFSQIVAELEADGRPASKSLRQFADAEQSGDAALLLGFERPSRQRRIELFGKAIDPWNHKEADEERRRESLPPVYFRRLRRFLKTKKAKKWIVHCAQSLAAIALLAAGFAHIKLYGFKAANLATVQHIQLCRDTVVELEAAPSLHNRIDSGNKEIDQRIEAEQVIHDQVTNDQRATTVYSDCLSWARSGFGAIGK
jgi:hypothetical protein